MESVGDREAAFLEAGYGKAGSIQANPPTPSMPTGTTNMAWDGETDAATNRAAQLEQA